MNDKLLPGLRPSGKTKSFPHPLFLLLLLACSIPLLSASSSKKEGSKDEVSMADAVGSMKTIDADLYYAQLSGNRPPKDLFIKGLQGHQKIGRVLEYNEWNQQYLTLIDLRLSSNEKRLWVIDLKQQQVIYHLLVAHGRKSGEEFATQFSNIPTSNQSSLGFYLTGDSYQGKHGTSLYLDGLEPGINGKARKRTIVIHGADYVSEQFIADNGRLGRSLGCPAVSMEVHEALINRIQGKTCLFIYYPDKNYEKESRLLNDAGSGT